MKEWDGRRRERENSRGREKRREGKEEGKLGMMIQAV